MFKTNLVNIKTVLFDLSQLLDDRYWNEAKMLEWAVKGFRSLNIESKFIEKLDKVDLDSHKAQLPKDLKFIVSIAYSDGKCLIPLTPASTAQTNNLCIMNSCPNCKDDFTVDENLILTTNKKDGKIFIAYLAYPTSDEGFLIPDDETVKEAITSYVLWKYWTSKSLMKEEGADSRSEYYRNLWSIYSKKALSLNNPTAPELENIKNRWNSILPSTSQYTNLFVTLNSPENARF